MLAVALNAIAKTALSNAAVSRARPRTGTKHVNAHRIPQGMEVGGPVPFGIDGTESGARRSCTDRCLQSASACPTRIHNRTSATSAYVDISLRGIPLNPCPCVRKLLANYEIHQRPRSLVSDPASPRHSRVERSDSRTNTSGLVYNLFPHAADVFGIVLPVRVRRSPLRYNSGNSPARDSGQSSAQRPCRGLWRDAKGALRAIRDRIEDRRMSASPIIHDNYLSVGELGPAIPRLQQGLAGLIGRNTTGTSGILLRINGCSRSVLARSPW